MNILEISVADSSTYQKADIFVEIINEGAMGVVDQKTPMEFSKSEVIEN